MRQLIMSMGLAARDWRFERALSWCAVLALAAMLTPLLVLQGVRNGLVESLRERLLEDPEVLIVTPVGGGPTGFYSAQFVNDLLHLPGAKFAIARTRDSVTDLELRGVDGSAVVQLEPCAPGEPVLERYNAVVPDAGESRADNAPGIVLSLPAAGKLGVQAGDIVEARLARRTMEGRLESTPFTFVVTSILPAEASGRRIGFTPLSVLEDLEDYRDGFAVPRRGYAGTERGEVERRYASFRLYANNLDAVEKLAADLAAKQIETRTKSREIADIRIMDGAIARVMLIIAITVGTGFVAFTISSVQGAVRRKDKMLGMLRLLGFSRAAMAMFPLVQALLTGGLGCALSGCVYMAVSAVIDAAFAVQSGGMELCRLGVGAFAIASALVLGLSAITAAFAAVRAARIEPSAVIREV